MPILGSPPAIESDYSTFPPGWRFPGPLVTVGSVAFGQVDANAVEWTVQNFEGWDSTPEVVSQKSQRTSAHGLHLGPQTYAGRALTLDGFIKCRSQADREVALSQLKRSLPVNGLSVVRVSDPPERYVRARIDGQLKISRTGQREAILQIPMIAPDPRKYHLSPDAITVQMPTAALGISLPTDLPVALPVRSNNADQPATNYGDMDCPWTARIDGAIAGPTIEAPDLGAEWGLNITLGVGDWLDIDSRAKTVLLNGVASRSGLILRSSSWFEIPADSSTTVRLSAASVPDGGTPVLTFTALSADA